MDFFPWKHHACGKLIKKWLFWDDWDDCCKSPVQFLVRIVGLKFHFRVLELVPQVTNFVSRLSPLRRVPGLGSCLWDGSWFFDPTKSFISQVSYFRYGTESHGKSRKGNVKGINCCEKNLATFENLLPDLFRHLIPVVFNLLGKIFFLVYFLRFQFLSNPKCFQSILVYWWYKPK